MAEPARVLDVFAAISGPSRRAVLDALADREMTVGAIVAAVALPQPQVSKHLRVLSDAGLVRCRAQGRRRLYHVEPSHLRPLAEWLGKYERAWEDRMDRVDAYLRELLEEGDMS